LLEIEFRLKPLLFKEGLGVVIRELRFFFTTPVDKEETASTMPALLFAIPF
jgi:hypothetical protein